VYSYTVVRHQTHPAFDVPYTIALVEMEEGPRVIAQLRGSGAETPEIGTPVQIDWDDSGEQTLPVFLTDA
jgi:uncharacterized OB-fold protein